MIARHIRVDFPPAPLDAVIGFVAHQEQLPSPRPQTDNQRNGLS